MAYSSDFPVVATGDLWTAGQHKTYLKDNLAAIWVGTTAGDDDLYTSATAKSRRAIGTAGQISRTNAGATAKEWYSQEGAIEFTIGNGQDVITTGVKGGIEVPCKCTIKSVRIAELLATSGSIVVDLWVDTYANLMPTDADSITDATPPTVTTATKSEDTTLTDWTVALAKGSWIFANVDSCTTMKIVTVSVIVERTA